MGEESLEAKGFILGAALRGLRRSTIINCPHTPAAQGGLGLVDHALPSRATSSPTLGASLAITNQSLRTGIEHPADDPDDHSSHEELPNELMLFLPVGHQEEREAEHQGKSGETDGSDEETHHALKSRAPTPGQDDNCRIPAREPTRGETQFRLWAPT